MSFDNAKISSTNKTEFFRSLRAEAKAMHESYWLTNLANLSATLNRHLPDINWVGFYLIVEGELKLGPFQGNPACLRIPLGKGVCGTSAKEKKTLRVADVHTFPGHISCDSRSRSEMVIPLLHGGRVLGVLDIDSPSLNRFDAEDQAQLELIAQDLIEATHWPENF